jgi:hypothetical protein
MHYQQMYDKLISQLAFSKGEGKETPLVFPLPKTIATNSSMGFSHSYSLMRNNLTINK